ncbi:efflux RND transporter periplasmic adaptor subunit [Thaumasiovibrio sp. DFM-14]|uniref:efflux RND transporter periplasmic adaptor subunit n=1 Tax=Thaumasiovibrio sp. DFM-14 TaxID=3384792 RepID=UPI0039A21CF8
MKKWIFGMLCLAVLLFGSVIGFNLYKQKMIANHMASMPEPEFPVTALEATLSDWVPIIEVIGFIEPNQGVTLTTEVAGIIENIDFDSGANVIKSQPLISLNADVQKANLESVTARLPAAEAKYVRYQGLFKKGSVAKEALDEAQADFLALRADIKSLQETIQHRSIQAPFAGIVGLRNVFLGQYLQPGDDIVRLEDISIMRLRFTIPQTQLADISLQQKMAIFVDAYPEQTFEGTISAIEPAVNYQSGLIQVQADIPNSNGQLRSGMFARAHIILPALAEQIVLPQTAISFNLYGSNVYIVAQDDDGTQRVTQSVISVGERKGAVAHILAGVASGDKIVTSGQVRLSNGAKVRIVENNALTPPTQTPQL